MKKLTEMTTSELEAYKTKWQKKRSGFQAGSKNYQKTSRRIKRANIQLAKTPSDES